MNDQTTATMMSLLPLILIFVIFYFMLIRPQKKRDKETARMHANLEVGDEIVTVGGIIGTVVVIKDDHLIAARYGSHAGLFKPTTPRMRSQLQKNKQAWAYRDVQMNTLFISKGELE